MLLTIWKVFKSRIELIVSILEEIFGDSKIACLSILLKGASIASVDKSCKFDVSASTYRYLILHFKNSYIFVLAFFGQYLAPYLIDHQDSHHNQLNL